MRNVYSLLLIIFGVPLLTATFYFYEFGQDIDKVFLSISTFLFSIFTGFFISRQASRFNKVRETVTRFDGLMSGMYRTSRHVSLPLQTAFGEVIVRHYEKIFQTQRWNIHFLSKSTTLVELHQLLEDHIDEKTVTKLSNQAIGSLIKSLASTQDVRKQMVALYKERIPFEQWILILFFGLMLIGTACTAPSQGLLFFSLVKAAFIISIFSVLFILYRLNNLAYTEKLMGEESARDVVALIEGVK